METHILRWIAVAIVAIVLIYFLVKVFDSRTSFNTALRNSGANSAYSLSKVQLLWWTVIIVVCFTISWGETGVIKNVLNASCLTLLGISLGTTTAGKIIDNSEEGQGLVRHQVTRTRTSFWTDILSDHDGVNLHRFQSVIFNILFGVVFIAQFFERGVSELPEFGANTLGLLGLSSGGYVALKFNENLSKRAARSAQQNPTPTNQPPPPVQQETPPPNPT